MWMVQIVGGKAGQVVETVTSRLTFYHYIERCVLTTTNKQLPKWGFEQQEVTCNPNIRDKAAQWNVEDNQFDKCNYRAQRISSFRSLAGALLCDKFY